MAIVSSRVAINTRQGDGRRYVREAHTDDLGRELFYDYLAPEGADVHVALREHAAMIEMRERATQTDTQ